MRVLQGENALIHEFGHFMTVLKELLFPLVYYLTVNKFILERKSEVMKHFLKGVAAVAIVTFLLMSIHIFFNIKGIDLNGYIPTVVEVILASGLGTSIYQALIRNEKNRDDQE